MDKGETDQIVKYYNGVATLGDSKEDDILYDVVGLAKHNGVTS